MNLKGQNRRKTADKQHQKNAETKARWERSKYLVKWTNRKSTCLQETPMGNTWTHCAKHQA